MTISESLERQVVREWKTLFAAAASRVTSVRWAPFRALLERPEPFAHERDGLQPIRKTSAREPADVRRHVRYGYSDAKQIITAQRYTGSPPRIASQSAWLDVDGTKVFAVASGDDPEYPAGITRLQVPRYQHGVLIGLDERRLGVAGFDSEEYYVYEDNKLVRMRARELRSDGEITIDWTVTYDPDGEIGLLSSVVHWPSRTPELFVDYRRPTHSTMKDSLKLVSKAIPEAVAAWLQRSAPSDPVVAVALFYSEEIPSVTSALALLTEADRRRLAAQTHAGADPPLVWNPAEWTLVDPSPAEFSSNRELVEAGAALVAGWGPERLDAERRQLLLSAAREIAASPPPGIAVADDRDLIVVAVDGELADLDQTLLATVDEQAREDFERP
jgi:hypothetical protein